MEERQSDGEELAKFSNNIDSSDKYSATKNQKRIILLALIISIATFIVVLIYFIVYLVRHNDDDKEKNLHSFKAIYQTTIDNQTIDLLNFPKNNISKMILDDEIIQISNNFTFKSSGNHTLYVLFNLKQKYIIINGRTSI